ncbi:MAG: hypothetical protein HOQ21_09850 [Dermatophilaceae bacterium]|nr:hypothetical protein [Dermatophilaceae bacterium]
MQPDRHPLAGVAAKVGAIRAAVGAAVSALAVVGVLTTDQSAAVDAVLGAVAVLASALGPLWAAFSVKSKGEPLVTPVADPRDNDGRQLRAVA